MTTGQRLPPQDLDMEESVIGAMMLSTADRRTVFDFGVTADDFYKPLNRAIFKAMVDLHTEGAAIDRHMLRDRMKREDIGVTIDDATIEHYRSASIGVAGGLRGPCKIIQRDATSRRAIAFLDRALESAWEGNPEDVVEVLDRAALMLAPPLDELAVPPIGASQLAAEDHDVDWIVPLWLARQEIVLFVAEPGSGKTTLLNQIVTSIASAVHPWNRAYDLPAPVRCLVFDAQDSRGARGRGVQAMLKHAGQRYPGNRGEPDTLFYVLRSQGFDLTSTTDQRWFEANVIACKPDVIVAGPLYNMVKGAAGRSKQSEETAEMAGFFLSEVVQRRNCALLIEAHAPHGDELRVRGSKYWEDWAGWGLGLTATITEDGKRLFRIKRFRGDREAGRQWPEGWEQGHPDFWPWEAYGVPKTDGGHPEQQKF